MEKIEEFIMCYMNGIQAVYHLASLGVRIDIAVTHLEIFGNQPSGLLRKGDRSALHKGFCKFQEAKNRENGGNGDPGKEPASDP